VSYDVAVWVGRKPPTDGAATEEFDRLSRTLGEGRRSPDAKILRFIEALTTRYPDLTDLSDEDIDDSPWADGPLGDNASGRFFYFALVPSGVPEALPFIAATAKAMGLICYDPERERLIVPSEADLHPKEPLRKVAQRVEREAWIAEGFRYRKGMFRRVLSPDIEAVVAAMTGPGANAPLSLRGRVGLTLVAYELELEAVFGRRPGYSASIITDLGGLVPKRDRHWYEDVSDEDSIRRLFDRFRHDLREVGIPWALSLADKATLATWLEREQPQFHDLCLLALTYRDLDRVDDLSRLLAETEDELTKDAAQAERDLGYTPPMWMNDEWNLLATYLRPKPDQP
jgi:hypothetical protein